MVIITISSYLKSMTVAAIKFCFGMLLASAVGLAVEVDVQYVCSLQLVTWPKAREFHLPDSA